MTTLDDRATVLVAVPAQAPVRRDHVRTDALGSGLAVAALGLAGAGRPSLWYDEAASVSAAGRPLRTLPALLGHLDLVHGLYYVLLHGWAAVFGTSAVALRSLSALGLGLVAAGCVVLGHRLRGRAVGLAAGAGCALLPGLVWSATEVREWSLVTAAVTWATVALLAAVEHDRRRAWAAYGLVMTLAVGLSVLTVLMAVPHVWLARRAGRLRGLVLAGGAAVVVTLPLLVATSGQRAQVAWIALTPRQAARQVLLDQLFTGDQQQPYPHATAVGVVLAAVFVLCAAVALAGRSRAARLGAVWVAAPSLLLAGPVLLGVQLYQARYLTYAAPGAVLLAADGAVRLAGWGSGRAGRQALLAGLAGAAVLASGTALRAQHAEAAKSGDDYRALAAAARGADEVLYERGDARGVRLAYPRDFAGVADPGLGAGPAASGTLWGTDRPAGPPHGDVVAYVFVQRPVQGPVWLAARLEGAGCVERSRHAASRWAAVRYACP